VSHGGSLRDALLREPVAPRFGTSGIRGLVSELTDLEVYCVVLGTVRHLAAVGLLARPGDKVVIPVAGDLRPSTERMMRAAARAIRDAGYAVEHAGRIPTPALALRCLERGTAGFVVTGSHIPLDRNGVKAYRRDGEILKSDEGPIAAAIDRARRECLGAPADSSPFDPDAMLRSSEAPTLPPARADAARAYQARYANAFAPDALAGMRVLLFEHSAVGRDLMARILECAGAEVVSAGRSEAFVPIDTEALAGEQLEQLGALARAHGPVDVVVSTDGDGDRPLLVDLDAHGAPRFVRGDLLGAIVAGYLDSDAAAVPVSASPAIEEWARDARVALTATRVGSPYVIEAMTAAANGHARVVGWEANGGFLTGSELHTEWGALRALPTRDAALPLLAALRSAVRTGQSVAEQADRLARWHGASDLLDEVPREVGEAVVGLLGAADSRARRVCFEPGAVRVEDARGDALEVLAPDRGAGARWQSRRRRVEAELERSFGRADIVRVDLTDGMRLMLANGEVAHVRPSGNAPQLRIYVFSRSAERAEAIAREAVAEPDGLLRRLGRIATGRA
jgi:phosphomannomutase